MPKAIKIPENLVIRNLFTQEAEQAVSFHNYLELAIFGNPQFDNPAGWRLTAKLAATASLVKPGSEWVIDSADWEKLKNADENPMQISFDHAGQKIQVPGIRGCGPSQARQLLAFSDAIQNATDLATEKKDA